MNFLYLANDVATTATQTGSYYAGTMGLLMIIGLFFMFRKAGHAGWKAIVPFYNLYIMNKIVFGNGWLFLIVFVPIVNGFYYIYLFWKLAEAYGRGTVGKLLTVFFPGFMSLVMGLGESKYVGEYYNRD